MPVERQAVVDAIVTFIKEMKIKREITEIIYRADYQDFQVTFDNTHHCEINEQTMTDFMKTKNGDLKREIQFKINHPFAWEEWDRPVDPGAKEEKIDVDDE